MATSIIVNTTEYTYIHYAWFAKPKSPATIGAGVNGLKESLQISTINIDGYKDITLGFSNFKKITSILGNPKVHAVLVLPQSVFISFNFDKFVYLKHKDFQGYFFVEKIENYKDGSTPVKVYLLMVDPQTSMIERVGDSEGETDLLLLETGDYILLETGDNIILE